MTKYDFREMMDIQLNELSKKEFDPALINEITPDTGYSIWSKHFE